MIIQIAAIVFLVLWVLWGVYIHRNEPFDWVTIIWLGFLMSIGTMILSVVTFFLFCAAS